MGKITGIFWGIYIFVAYIFLIYFFITGGVGRIFRGVYQCISSPYFPREVRLTKPL